MATTTKITYNLCKYADQSAPGVDFKCTKKIFDTLESAKQDALDDPECQSYDIQFYCVETTPPSKKDPKGKTEITKLIVERSQKYPKSWSIA